MPLEVPDGWEVERDASMSMLRANVLALGAFLAAAVAFLAPHALLWGGPEIPVSPEGVFLGVGAGLAAFALGLVFHEGLHKAGFLIGGVASADVRFGFDLATLTPFTRCRVPLEARRYRVAIALPGIALGLLPGLAGLATGVWPLTLFGMFFTGAAGGDALALWAIRRVPSSSMVLDHPSRVGCSVLRSVTPERY